jgi:hypothetical protein
MNIAWWVEMAGKAPDPQTDKKTIEVRLLRARGHGRGLLRAGGPCLICSFISREDASSCNLRPSLLHDKLHFVCGQ